MCWRNWAVWPCVFRVTASWFRRWTLYRLLKRKKGFYWSAVKRCASIMMETAQWSRAALSQSPGSREVKR